MARRFNAREHPRSARTGRFVTDRDRDRDRRRARGRARRSARTGRFV